jgi:hypothetical protein
MKSFKIITNIQFVLLLSLFKYFALTCTMKVDSKREILHFYHENVSDREEKLVSTSGKILEGTWVLST